MKILSLFDGVSVARVALERVGFKDIKNYWSSEVDRYAIQIAQKNYPDTIQLGDVSKLGKGNPYPQQLLNEGCDLIIFGSPCTDLSIAKKNREGLRGKSSGLFYEAVRIIKDIKPKYFIMENVASMSKDSKEEITKVLGVEPIMINAALLSAQNRRRLFWVGKLVGNTYEKVEIPQPQDRNILLKDILEDDVDEKYYLSTKRIQYVLNRPPSYAVKIDPDKTNTLRTNYGNSSANETYVTTRRIGQLNSGGQGDRIYSSEGKSVNLSANGGGRGAKTGLYVIKAPNGKYIELPVDNEISTFKEVRTEIGKQKRRELRQQTGLDSTKRGKDDKKYVIQDSGKGNCITTGLGVEGLVAIKDYVRKLTPVEAERLQSLPDNYTAGISNTQRYKCLGNAFNCEVIKHILSFLIL